MGRQEKLEKMEELGARNLTQKGFGMTEKEKARGNEYLERFHYSEAEVLKALFPE